MKLIDLFENDRNILPDDYEDRHVNVATSLYDITDGKLNRQFKEVKGRFTCHSLGLISLEGCPEIVGENFDASGNNLTSFRYAPKIIKGDCILYNNPVESLEGIGKDYILEVDYQLDIDDCEVKSNMLGILKIKNLQNILFNFNTIVEAIINKHLKGDRNILKCQKELIQNGFKDYAKL